MSQENLSPSPTDGLFNRARRRFARSKETSNIGAKPMLKESSSASTLKKDWAVPKMPSIDQIKNSKAHAHHHVLFLAADRQGRTS